MTRLGFVSFLILAMLLVAGAPRPSFAEEANGAAALAPMNGDALAAASGGSEAAITSNVVGNTMGNSGNTGSISNINVTGNSGLTTLIENSGNQVSISTSTVVNVTFH
jgi:hypothetical protein